MTLAEQGWIRRLGLAALLLGAGAVGYAQTPAAPAAALGSLTGKLTDLHSSPLGGVTVILRNQATGAEQRTVTAKNGAYRFAALLPGGYALAAENGQLGRGQLEDIEIAAGHEARVQAAMDFDAMPPAAAPGPSTPPAIAAAAAPANSPRGEIGPEELGFTGALTPEPLLQPALHLRAVRDAAEIPLSSDEIPAALPPRALANLRVPAREIDPPGVSTTESAALPAAVTAAARSALVPCLCVAADAAAANGLLTALSLRAPQLWPVAESAPQAEVAATAVTTTIGGDRLQALPSSGRRWQELFLDTPAAALEPGDTQIALRGAGQDPADATIDGASTRLAFAGQEESGSYPAGRSVPGQGFAVSEAAIREVRVVAGNVEAEGAHAAGGRTGIETESGGNALHGQGFAFDRQNTWGARNPFTTWEKETAPGTATTTPVFTAQPYTPPDHETVWGVGAGGRIRPDKLFWFAALDGYSRNDPGVASVKEPEEFFAQPSNNQMQLLSAQLDLPSADPVGEGLGAYSPMLEALDGLLGPAPRQAAQWVGFARLDWHAAERHRFALEGTAEDWDAPGGGLTRVSESYGNRSFGSSHASQEWLLARWETFLTPNLLLVTQGSGGREILTARPETPSALEQTFLSGNSYGQLPQIAVDSRYGFTIGNPSRFGQGSYPDEHLYRGQEMADWVRGKLLVKAGFEMDHNVDATTLVRNQTGSYHYSTVENFAADALTFEKFGTDPSSYRNPHNCDATGKAWTAGGTLMGLGSLPCYSYFTQTIGPAFWQVSTNDFAGYATAQWQMNKLAVFSAGLRWEREQLPGPMALVDNPALPLTERLPDLGNQWGPRVSLAIGNRGRWPVLRMAYGVYYGRTGNSAIETALTQTGSLKGDLSFFIRPTDGLNNLGTSGAPQFPDVLNGQPGSVVVPGAVEYAPRFRNPEVQQGLASVEQELPGHMMVTASAIVSLGRRLASPVDANIDPAVNPGTITAANPGITYQVCDQAPTGAGNTQCGQLGLGPIRAPQITLPFYALWPAGQCPAGALLNVAGQCGRLNPAYQQVTEMMSRANSTYEAAMVRLTRYGERGLSLHAHYTYAHAMDWNPGQSPFNPADFSEEYGTSNLDMRHSAAVMAIYEAPWKLRRTAGRFANGWMLSGIGQFHSGLPYTMRTAGSVAEEFTSSGTAAIGLGTGVYGAGGDSRVPGVGRNTFRYPRAWKADLRLAKRFNLGEMRQLELLAESFNLFNHQNVTEIETTGYFIQAGSPASGLGAPATPPTLNFLTGLKVNATTGLPIPAFGQPLNVNATDFYRERQVQLGARFRF